VHNNFTHTVSHKLEGAITKEQDNTSQIIFDEHNIDELVQNFGKYDQKHFSKGNETKLNYRHLFYRFLERLHFGEKLNELAVNNENNIV
jgi:hypothetical protein